MKHDERARELFRQGYNCCQALVGAYCEEMGLSMDDALALSSSFGGGMAQMRSVCGAVSGMFMVAGMLRRDAFPADIGDPTYAEAKKAHYAFLKRLAGEFAALNGSLSCMELLGLSSPDEEPDPAHRLDPNYKKRPCVELIGDAALLLDRHFGF